MPNPRDIALSRLDDEASLPGGSRAGLFKLVSKYRPEQLTEVERVLKANGIRDEDMLDVAHHILDDSTPGGFGPDPVGYGGGYGSDPVTGEPPVTPIPPAYAPQEMSGGQTMADILGKLMGGISIGASEPAGGNPAAAAAGYVRTVQRDQQSLEAGRRRDAIADRRLAQEDRRIGQEDKRFSWEERQQAKAVEEDSPDSPMAKILRKSMIDAATEKHGPPSADHLQVLNLLSAENLKVLASQQSEELQTEIENKFRQLTIDVQRENAAASRENAAASRGIAASNAESTAAFREATLADKAASREATIADREARREEARIAASPERQAEIAKVKKTAEMTVEKAQEVESAKESIIPNLVELRELLAKNESNLPGTGITGRTVGLFPSFGEDAQRAEQIMADLQLAKVTLLKGSSSDRDFARAIMASVNPNVKESVNIKSIDKLLDTWGKQEKRTTGTQTIRPPLDSYWKQ